MTTAIRLGSLLLGLICAALGAYGAFEFAHRLEGGTVTYLVLAAPVIAVTAALIPPIAEATWRSGHSLKALLWWAVLVPAGAVVFFSASERVHDGEGRCRSRAQRSSQRCNSSQGSTHQERSEPGHGASRGQRSAGSEAVRSCLQDQALSGSGGASRRGSCETGAALEREQRPPRTVLFRRRCGYSQRRSTWWPSWPSGPASQAGPSRSQRPCEGGVAL